MQSNGFFLFVIEFAKRCCGSQNAEVNQRSAVALVFLNLTYMSMFQCLKWRQNERHKMPHCSTIIGISLNFKQNKLK